MSSAIKPRRTLSRARLVLLGLFLSLSLAVGCTGLLQNLGARWVTKQIAGEFNLDDAQTAATRASVDRLLAAAPAALSSKIEMLVATVDVALAKGLTEDKLLGMERQVDNLVDIVAGAVIDEASPILATLRDDQIDFAKARISERLDEAREELEKPKEERLEDRQGKFVESVEDWAGEITNAQDASLRGFVAQLPDEAEQRLAADQARLERIAMLLREHPGAEAIRGGLWREWKDRENWGPHVRTAADRRAEGRKTLLYVYGLLTPEQIAHASDHLHELHRKITSFLGVVGQTPDLEEPA